MPRKFGGPGIVQPKFELRLNRKEHTPKGCDRALRTAALISVFAAAVSLGMGTILSVLQHGLDVVSVTVGLFAMLLLGLSVYFSPVPQALRVLIRHEQAVKRRQARNRLRHQRKVSRLADKIEQGAAYHLGADGELVLDKTTKYEADGGDMG